MALDLNNLVFVFGSNLSGLHGAGAARFAERNRGAVRGVFLGRSGMSYAIPTKDKAIRKTLALPVIQHYIEGFLNYAFWHDKEEFQVTRIGCGLAGLKDEQIAPLFKKAPRNCLFDEAWRPYLGDNFRYWGTV